MLLEHACQRLAMHPYGRGVSCVTHVQCKFIIPTDALGFHLGHASFAHILYEKNCLCLADTVCLLLYAALPVMGIPQIVHSDCDISAGVFSL